MTFSASRSKKCPPSAMPSRPFSMMRKNGSSALKSSRSVIVVVMMGPGANILLERELRRAYPRMPGAWAKQSSAAFRGAIEWKGDHHVKEARERSSRPWWLRRRRRVGGCLQDSEEGRLQRQHRPEPDSLAGRRRCRYEAHTR